ncbi:uncharacterized protein LOC135936879 [Cloeon dipterum]|uniref:uncharacterized protein LOC135936879 n=1 Tax=Cloeon dipterum TaxID=197152 RepID=UPI00321FDDD8
MGLSISELCAGPVENAIQKFCEKPDIIHNRKVQVASCIAVCLGLNSESPRCNYSSSNGKAIEMYNNFQPNGCPKCYLPPAQNLALKRVSLSLAQSRWITACGKRINYSPVGISVVYDETSTICGLALPGMRHWLPRDYNEVACVIENMPENVQNSGRLRVTVYKSACSKEFFFCSTDTPRSIRKSFMAAELNNGNLTVFQNRTCAYFEFKMQQKKAVDIRLTTSDCMDKSFLLCEGDD